MNKDTKITVELLKEAGFENITMPTMIQYHKDEFGFDNYCEWRIWTSENDKQNCLKLDIDNGPNNRGTKWHLHIDNCDCCTIGSADIDTVWEFNTLMEIFNSKFRL